MSLTSHRNSAPTSPDDPTLSLILAAFASVTPTERLELLAFLDFFRELSREDRALFVRATNPALTDERVARIAGVARRTLYRWPWYQRIKPTIDDLRASKPRWSNPDRSDA